MSIRQTRIAGWIGLCLLAALLASCGGRGPDTARPDPSRPGPVAPEPPAGPPERVLTVYAAPTLASLVHRLAAAYEAQNPGLRLNIRTGQRGPVLDPAANIARDINAGEPIDVFAAERAWQIDELTRPPQARRPWVTNSLVAVTGRGSGLRLIDLSTGRAGIAVALDRTALGGDSRAALEARGVWPAVAERTERFDDAAAILERARWGARSPDAPHVLGIVYRTDARGPGAEGLRTLGELPPPPGEEVVHELAAWTEDGEALISWLSGDRATRIARELGFGEPE